MLQQHHITPPPELVLQWYTEACNQHGPYYEYIATQAARWGADQELEACCEQLDDICVEAELRAARRPKPLSLAEQALTLLDDASTRLDAAHENTIRRALKRLQELEQGNG